MCPKRPRRSGRRRLQPMKLGQSLQDAWKAVREWNLLAGAGCLFVAVGLCGVAVLSWAGLLLERWLPSGFVERWGEWFGWFATLGILVLLAAWLKSLLGRLLKWLFRVFRGELSWGEMRWSLRSAGESVLFIAALPLLPLLLPFLLLYGLLKWLRRLPYMNLGQLRSEGSDVLMFVWAMVVNGVTFLAWMAFFVVGALLLGGLLWVARWVLLWVFS